MQKFSTREEVDRIDKAIKGYNKDNKQFLEIIGRRSCSQLQEIKGEYDKTFDCDLSKKLEQDIDRNVVNLVKALFKDHVDYKVDKIYESVRQNKYGEETLINFIIGDTCENVEKTKQLFEKKYKLPLVDLVKEHTSGPFRDFMLRMVENKRCKGISEDSIHKELEILKSEKQGKWCKDEVMSIFANRSPEHLQKISSRMKECCNVTLGEMITNETEGYFKDALLACSFPLEVFWANRIHTALKRYSSDDCLLVCCFSQCSKPFLQSVAKEYIETFGFNLTEHVKKYTSGNLSVLLLTLLDFPETELNLYKSK